MNSKYANTSRRTGPVRIATAYFYSVHACTFNNVIGQYKMQTTDCRLQNGFKMQTRYKMQTAD